MEFKINLRLPGRWFNLSQWIDLSCETIKILCNSDGKLVLEIWCSRKYLLTVDRLAHKLLHSRKPSRIYFPKCRMMWLQGFEKGVRSAGLVPPFYCKLEFAEEVDGKP